jgi:hypothetical protein
MEKEGAQQVKEELESYEQVGRTMGQARCLIYLAWLLREDRQFCAAGDIASRAINLFPTRDNQFLISLCSRRVQGRDGEGYPPV